MSKAPPKVKKMDAQAARTVERAKSSSLGQLLINAARLFSDEGLRRIRGQAKFAKLRAAHAGVLPHLDVDGTSVTELARRMGVSKQAVSQLLDDMEKAGVVSRDASPTDKRAKVVTFTTDGKNALLASLEALNTIEREITKTVGKAKLDALRDALPGVIEGLDGVAAKAE